MVATQRGPGRPTLSATLVHFAPPSRLTHKAPSSVPTQSTSGLRGDSARAVADDNPVLLRGAGPAGALPGPPPAPVALKPAIDVIRPAVIDRHMIELPNRQVVEVVPMGHAIVGCIEAAVAADQHVPAIA